MNQAIQVKQLPDKSDFLLSVNLEWAMQITKAEFFKRVKELPTAKGRGFLSSYGYDVLATPPLRRPLAVRRLLHKEPAKAHMEQQIAASGKESYVVCHGIACECVVDKMHRKGRE